jgi:hypothetical protein
LGTTTDVRQRVKHALAGEIPHTHEDDDGDLNFRSGAAHVWVIVRSPWDDERQVIDIHAITNSEVPVTDELRGWVGDKANNYIFGHVSYLRDRDDPDVARVRMNHRLLAHGASDEAILVAVRAVAVSSRRVAREVRDRFGGDTWHPFPEGE